jgi:protein tyrosine phosphatase
MPFIENISRLDAREGFHKDPGENSMLIQITDVHIDDCPAPKYPFKHIHRFAFLDVEKDDSMFEEYGIKEDQAEDIARLLKFALEEDANVIVHCMMGLCRSGAVVDAGVALGFTDTFRVRKPNLTVKHMVMKDLGLAYDPEKSAFKDWRATTQGIFVPAKL